MVDLKIPFQNKNKTLYFAALEQSSSKRKKLRDSNYEWLDHVVFRWFLSQRSQNILIDGIFIKEKALQYGKEFCYNEFQASNGLQCTKYSISFTTFLNLWKTKILIFSAISNIHYVKLFHRVPWRFEITDVDCSIKVY